MNVLTRAILAAMVLPLLAPLAPPQAADVTKPNVLIILIDDLGYADIGPFGMTKQKTPNLDRMAAEGMKITFEILPRHVVVGTHGGPRIAATARTTASGRSAR